MKLQIEKIKSYIGFAIKSRHVCFGTDEILKLNSPEIILFSSALGDNSKSKLTHYLNSKNLEIFEIDDAEFKELITNKNILAFAVTDKNLAQAIRLNIQK